MYRKISRGDKKIVVLKWKESHSLGENKLKYIDFGLGMDPTICIHTHTALKLMITSYFGEIDKIYKRKKTERSENCLASLQRGS